MSKEKLLELSARQRELISGINMTKSVAKYCHTPTLIDLYKNLINHCEIELQIVEDEMKRLKDSASNLT
jgi:hypothetical protein